MWPEGRHAAATLTFDFDAEEVQIGEDSENATSPVLSQGTYRAKVPVALIPALVARHGDIATFLVAARVADRHPERVRQIVEAGHELAHHVFLANLSPVAVSRPA